MTEAHLDQAVKDLARWLRLYAYHTRDSRGSARGFPDWVIAGPGGILYREDKSDTGTLSPDQRAWGVALVAAGGNWSVWRPGDWRSGRVRREMEALAEPAADRAGLIREVAVALAVQFGADDTAAEVENVASLVVGMVLSARTVAP
jgi:hypothetical protein